MRTVLAVVSYHCRREQCSRARLRELWQPPPQPLPGVPSERGRPRRFVAIPVENTSPYNMMDASTVGEREFVSKDAVAATLEGILDVKNERICL